MMNLGMEEHKVKVEGSRLIVKFDGDYQQVSEEAILQHHPSVRPLLDEIKSKGWTYGFSRVSGVAVAEVDLLKKEFSFYRRQPDPMGNSGKSEYHMTVDLGEELPAKLEVQTVSGFEIEISTPKFRRAATINTFKNKMSMYDPLSDGLFDHEEDKPLADVRELYELAKWLASKNYARDKYADEAYYGLMTLFEHKEPFYLTLEAVVEDESKVPPYDEFREGLNAYCRERGLAVTLAGNKTMFRKKPIP